VSQMVVITTSDPDTRESVRDVFEVTPPPEPGRERAVLAQLVTGIHPGATERSYADGVATFADGRRRITAEFAARGGDPPERDAQATLFDI
jgi:hypothetical protein